MLCQLSYRGLARQIVAGALGELADRGADLCEALLELEEVVGLRVGELSLQAPLTQTEQHLLRRLLGDVVGLAQRIDLREERRELAVRGLVPEQMRACALVQLAVEVLRAELPRGSG